MLYPTISQPLVILGIFCASLICGLLFDLSNILTYLSGNDKNSRYIFQFFATILSFTLIYFVNLYLNYGQFRVYILLIFGLSFTLERFFSKLLWTKLLIKCYNKFKNKRIRLWKKRRKNG